MMKDTVHQWVAICPAVLLALHPVVQKARQMLHLATWLTRMQDPAFDPKASSTVLRVPCNSSYCNCGTPKCECEEGNKCYYRRSYGKDQHVHCTSWAGLFRPSGPSASGSALG